MDMNKIKIEYNKIKYYNNKHLLYYGQQIKWYYWLPFGYFFNKNQWSA
jgi:hypothetical protein